MTSPSGYFRLNSLGRYLQESDFQLEFGGLEGASDLKIREREI